jgi:cleavage and polyadenylation specificity factor subunit 1
MSPSYNIPRIVRLLVDSSLDILSVGGQKLLRKSDLYLGSSIEKFVKIRKLSDPLQNFLIGGDEHGGIRLFSPVSEDMFKRLYGLYSKMVTTLRHYAGLNPRGFR